MHNDHYLSSIRLRAIVECLFVIISWFGLNGQANAEGIPPLSIAGTDRYFISTCDTGYGVVSKSGEVLIEPLYRQVDYLGNDRFGVRRYLENGNEERLLVNEHGKTLTTLPFWTDTSSRMYHDGILLLNGSVDQCIYMNLHGKRLTTEGHFRFGQDFHCGLAAVEYGNRGECYSAYINSLGKIAIGPFRDAECESFYKNKAIVKISKKDGTKKTGVITTSGRFIIPPIYDCIRRVNEEFHPSIESRNSFAQYFGDFVLIEFPATFRWINVPSIIGTGTLIPFGIIPDSGPNKGRPLWGYCDLSGKIVIEPKFETAAEFSGGIASVSIHDPVTDHSRHGHVDTKGNWLDNPSAILGKVKKWTNTWNKRELFQEILNSHKLIGMNQADRVALFGKCDVTAPGTMLPGWSKNFASYIIGSSCTGSTFLVFALDSESRIIGWKMFSDTGVDSPWVRENVYAISEDYARPGSLVPWQETDLVKQFGEFEGQAETAK